MNRGSRWASVHVVIKHSDATEQLNNNSMNLPKVSLLGNNG